MFAQWFSKIALAADCGLLGLSAVLAVVFARAVSAEQAMAPGEDSFGVAVLAMLYGPPIFATAAGGILSALVGLSIVTFQRLRTP